ncbi:MAG: hypothetical protein KGZ88_12010 [Methylomicrobium sp.]|nr:hypothetical protein [Methylomicrobium sp.]
MDTKNARPAEHAIITGEHQCNDRIPAERLNAYYQDRKPLGVNRKNDEAKPGLKK